MIRRYAAKSKEELLIAIWIDRNQDFPVSFTESAVELMTEKGWGIIRIICALDAYAIMWREGQCFS